MDRTGSKNEHLAESLNRPKKVAEILDEQIEKAMEEHKRSNSDVFVSAIAAGLELGFSVFLMGVLYSLYFEQVSAASLHMILSLAYPLGFIFVVIGKSELFTEHTTMAILPVFNRRTTIKSLLILWGVIYSGNLIGGTLFSLGLVKLPIDMGVILPEALVSMAAKMIRFDWSVILGSGILAGWLMGLLSWLVASSQETFSRIFSIILVTVVIGLGGLHHSIVGSIEVFSGMLLSEDITILSYLHVLTWSTFGNLIGGVVFVALLKFSYATRERIVQK